MRSYRSLLLAFALGFSVLASADSETNYQIFLDGWHQAARIIQETPAENFTITVASDETALASFIKWRPDFIAELNVKTRFHYGRYQRGPCMTTEYGQGYSINFWESNCGGLYARDFARLHLQAIFSHFIPSGEAAYLANAANRAFYTTKPNPTPRVNELIACDYAAKGIKTEVQKLLSPPASVSPDTVCVGTDRLLHVAVRNRRLAIVDILLAHGADVDAPNGNNASAIDLMLAESDGNEAMKQTLHKLMDASAEKPRLIATALTTALRWKDKPLFQAFVAYNVNTPEINNSVFASTLGLTGFRQGGWSAYWGSGGNLTFKRTANYDGAGWMLDAKLVNVNETVVIDGNLIPAKPYRPLHRVVRQTFGANVPFMERLVKEGAKVDAVDDAGHTAYDWVCSFKQLYLTRCLGNVQNPKCLERFDEQMRTLAPTLPAYHPVPEGVLATAASHYAFAPPHPGPIEYKFEAWCSEGLSECK